MFLVNLKNIILIILINQNMYNLHTAGRTLGVQDKEMPSRFFVLG